MRTEPTPDDGATLSLRTQRRSALVHRQVQASAFVTALLEGTLAPAAYGRYLRQLVAVYEAIEAAVAQLPEDLPVRRLIDSRLDRADRIRDDLRAWCGPDWASRFDALPATAAYVERVTSITTNPPRSVAHHYVRILGDVSGGQIIGRVVEDRYGVDASCGAGFYDFAALGDLGTFKSAYRAALDSAPWSSVDELEFLDEVGVAYALNQRLLTSLPTA